MTADTTGGASPGGRSGQVLPLVFVAALALLFAALWLADIHRVVLAKDEAQNAGDAAALVAARWLGDTLNLEGDLPAGAEEQPLPLTLKSGAIPFELRTVVMTREQRRAAVEATVAAHGGPEALASKPALVWEKDMLARESELTGREPIRARYVILGGVPIASMPFEGYTRIGQTIRAVTGREDALVLGCQEEMLGYLPTKDDIDQGGYAALESTYLYRRLPVMPGEAERLGEAMGQALNTILSEA